MRDLGSRLRDIVRRDRLAGGAPAAAPATDEPLRTLTYVPDADPRDTRNLTIDAADVLGGTALDGSRSCVVIDRRYEADRSHGRRRIESCRPDAADPIELFDPRVAAVPEWWRRVVFFDTETTGLSGGAGTLAFLVGCGWFEDSGDFIVRQFFLTGPAGERGMLEELGRLFADASLLVTYNGRTFDVPLMETRWAFHRTSAPTDGLPHFDMLPPARRLWGRREMAGPDTEGCSLSVLERRVLGFHRMGDVPGFEIPARYFQFVRTGDSSLIEGVLDHNRHDIVSLAAVMSHALWMVREGAEACREPSEQVALGRVYERARRTEDAVRAYEMAVATGDHEVRRHGLSRLALMHRRASRHQEAADAWQGVLDLVPRGRSVFTALERQAVEALAIHHEHRARDLTRARRYAEALGAATSGRLKVETDKRLRRIDRKMQTRSAMADAPHAEKRWLIED